jgi:hypothetical protein
MAVSQKDKKNGKNTAKRNNRNMPSHLHPPLVLQQAGIVSCSGDAGDYLFE